MNTTSLPLYCSLVLLADDFEEVEAIVVLSTLRQAGVCVKSVGLTGGFIRGAHGILVMPDLNMTDLSRSLDVKTVRLVMLPGDEYSLSRLGADPRVHLLLRQVIDQGGLVATGGSGIEMVRLALGYSESQQFERQLIQWLPLSQSIETFSQELVRKLV